MTTTTSGQAAKVIVTAGRKSTLVAARDRAAGARA